MRLWTFLRVHITCTHNLFLVAAVECAHYSSCANTATALMSTILYPPSSAARSHSSQSFTTDKSMFHVTSPVTNQVFMTRAYTTPHEFKDMMRKAKEAFPQWRDMSLTERCRIVLDSLKYFRENAEEIAEEITYLIGRPITSTPREVQGYISRVEYLVKIAPEALADIYPDEKEGKLATNIISLDTTLPPYSIPRDQSTSISNRPYNLKKVVKKEPLGIIAVISAWNYPYLISLRAVIPALLAGNVVILKPSTQVPAIAERMVQSFIDAGIPKGVFQYAHLCRQGTDALVRHPSVSNVQYTGSVDGGKAIVSATSNKFIDTVLELGSCDAAFVRQDVDLDIAIPELVDGAFFNSGQCCCGVQRIYIHKDIYDKFVELFKEQTIKSYGSIGNPLDPNTTLGPCVKAVAADTLRDLIDEDIAEGAINIMQDVGIGSDLDRRGSAYMAPVILTHVAPTMHVQKEEFFGPVVSLSPVNSDEEAVHLINDNQFGLTASVWTSNNEIVQSNLASKIQAGTVFHNKCDTLDPALPWSPTKNSGKGLFLSTKGFDYVTRPKSLYLRQFVYDKSSN